MYLFASTLSLLLLCSHGFANVLPQEDQPPEIDTLAGGAVVGLLTKLKELLRHGNATLGIPVLDPLQQKELHLNLNKPGLVELDATLENVLGNGLSMYTVTQGDFSLIGIHITAGLAWEQIALMTNYKMNGKLSGVSLYGDGHIAAVIKGLSVKADMKLNIEDQKLFVREMIVNLHLKELDFLITGLFNDEETSKLLSKVVSDIVPGMIDDYQNEFSKSVSPMVAKMLDKILKNFTLKDLLGMLG